MDALTAAAGLLTHLTSPLCARRRRRLAHGPSLLPAASGPRDGEVCLVRDLALTRAPGGTRVSLALAHRTRGRVGPVVYWAAWRWIRLGAGQTLTGIARAGAELP